MAGGWLNTAQTHMAAGRFEQARTILARALERHPADAAAASLLSATFIELGKPDQARFYARRARDQGASDPDLLYNVGKALLLLGDNADGVEALRAAVAGAPGNPSILAGLADGLVAGGQFQEAQEICRRGLVQFPGHPELAPLLARALVSVGCAREAIPVLQEAMARHPADLYIAGMLAFTMNYAGDTDPREVFEAHAAYGRLVESTFGSRPPPPADPDPHRPLRIGLLSGDLRAHAVSSFMSPFLEGHDRDSLTITCYSTAPFDDAASERLRSLVSGWRRVTRQTMPQLAQTIRQDRIDILIDLSGHTGGTRLPVFQFRPAPVAASYLGYPNTTGLRTVDYRIVDRHTDPPEARYDALATERLWRLDPCFLCYRVPEGAPEPGPPPSASGAPFTFGSFNNLAKHDDAALRLYARALAGAPGSRLLLKYHTIKDQARQALARRFEGAGVPSERLTFEPPGKDSRDMLQAYSRVDVMLDSFPYQGTTTTCEAMAMGVPPVSLAGNVSAARVGVSLLANVGLPELIADSEEQYGAIATGLARDPARLASLRSTLRERLRGSPLADERGFVRRFGGALRAMWQQRVGAPRS